MKGLRTQENEKFEAFFALIQEEAQKDNSVFFADAGDGNVFETPTMECEELMGWLVPEEEADKFEPLWKSDEVGDDWTDFFCWAEWFKDGQDIKVSFAKY